MRTEAPNPRSPQAIINIAQTVGSQWPLLVQPAGPDGRPGAAEDVYMVRVHGAAGHSAGLHIAAANAEPLRCVS